MTNHPYILVLERSHDLGSGLADLLELEGFECLKESDSSEGVKRVIERQPNAILICEDMLPLEDVGIIPLLRSLTKSPIIAIGDGDDESVVKALIQGADSYLKRPLNYLELLTRIRGTLRRLD